jgi:hypothetical protein
MSVVTQVPIRKSQDAPRPGGKLATANLQALESVGIFGKEYPRGSVGNTTSGANVSW